ncbi:MAG: hypothetical protein PVG60_04665 [Desulfarculaceae bacterium]
MPAEGIDQEQLFEQVKSEFIRRGLLRRQLRLQIKGKIYSVRCDEDCFTIYRINHASHLPPGLPGWMVLTLTPDDCFCLDREDSAQSGFRAGLMPQARAWAEEIMSWLDQNPDNS